MSDKIEYCVIAKSYVESDRFNEIVNKMIKEGWRPLGGISTLRDGVNWHFAQAMVRKSNL